MIGEKSRIQTPSVPADLVTVRKARQLLPVSARQLRRFASAKLLRAWRLRERGQLFYSRAELLALRDRMHRTVPRP